MIAEEIGQDPFRTISKEKYLHIPTCPMKGTIQDMIGIVVQTMQKGKSSSYMLIIVIFGDRSEVKKIKQPFSKGEIVKRWKKGYK